MSIATAEPESSPAPSPSIGDTHDYRAVCSAAVTSMIIAVIGLSAFAISELLLIPIVGLLLGFYAWLTIRRRRDEMTGMPLAIASIALCVVTLVGAGGWHTYVYATEVPEGFERISYRALGAETGRPDDQVPDSARELDGKQVFVKGYMLNTGKSFITDDFFLVRDKGDCCFGGNPNIDERIMVKVDGDPIKYTDRQSKVIGKFVVVPDSQRKFDINRKPVLYELVGEVIE